MKVDIVESVDGDGSPPVSNDHLLVRELTHRVTNEFAIRVDLSESGSFARCSVTDNGSSRDCRAPGEGLKIVEALTKELNGEIAHRFGPEGARSIVIFPSSTETLQTNSSSL
jgi:two-component sensor histidine kinase